MDVDEQRRLSHLHLEAEALAHVGSFEWDMVTQELFWSDELFRIYGYEPQSIEPSFDRFLSFVHPKDQKRVLANIQAAIETQGQFEQQESIIRADGEIRVLQTKGRVLTNEEGAPTRMIGACVDITELATALAQLNASEARYRTLVDHAADAMYLYEESGKIIDVNRRACDTLGFEREQLIGQYPMTFSPSMNRENIEKIKTLLNSQKEVSWESYHQCSNGRQFPVEIRMRGFEESGQKRSVAIARDISARKQSELALETSERRMRMILQSANMVLWEADPLTLQFSFVSEHCERMLGFSKSRWLEQNFWQECLHPEDAAEVIAARIQFISSYVTRSKASESASVNSVHSSRMEYRLLGADGRIVWVEDVVQVTSESDGATVLRGVMLDISDRRTLSEQLRQSQKMEAIGRLAGGVAHGFNNLLTVILSYGELMLMSLPADHPNRPWVESICDAGQRGSALTRQLLAYSRKAVVAPQRMDLNEVIRGAELLLRPAIGEGINLVIHTDPRLRPIRADRVHIEQVLMNLVINARDAMSGNGTLRIETHNSVKAHAVQGNLLESSFVELIVADDGCGMNEETISKIFDPFFTTKDIGHGTGLGLSVVQGVVTSAGGFIQVESSLGEGAKFHIYFPVDFTNEGTSEQIEDSRPVGGTERILLVEDDSQVRLVTAATLEKYGYEVVHASNADKALEIFAVSKKPIDLLLTDVVMPGMGGRGLAETIRRLNPKLPILFVSGHTDDAVLKQGINHQLDAFIQKPFQSNGLCRAIRELLDNRFD